MKPTTKEVEAAILASPATHRMVHEILRLSEGKDPLDAAFDSEMAAAILRGRCDRALGRVTA